MTTIWGPDIGPIDYGPNRLTPVTAEQLQTFVGALKEKLIANGATIISGKSGVVGTSAGDGERREIGDFPPTSTRNGGRLGSCVECLSTA